MYKISRVRTKRTVDGTHNSNNFYSIASESDMELPASSDTVSVPRPSVVDSEDESTSEDDFNMVSEYQRLQHGYPSSRKPPVQNQTHTTVL